MGKRSRHRELRYQKSESESYCDGESRQESYFFRKYAFDTKTFRLQWGLLTLDHIRELDLSDEEFAAMLISQLDLRDTCIDNLGKMLSEAVDNGCSIEKYNGYLLQKICELEQDEYSSRKSRRDERKHKSKDSDEKAVKYCAESSSRSQSPTLREGDSYRSSQSHKKESPLHKGWEREISESEISETSEHDKIKTMVAVALKMQEEAKNCGKECDENQSVNSEREEIRALVVKVLGNDNIEEINERKNIECDPEKEKIKLNSLNFHEKETKKASNESDGKEFDRPEREKIKDLVNKVLGNEFNKNEESKSDENSVERDKIKAMVSKALKTHISNEEIGSSESSEKDRIKAMVAMAFKAQGYGLFDSFKDSEKSKSSETSNVMKGWNTQTGQSVAEQVTAAATEAVKHSGYVYQEELGLYYDHNSGYYYNAENGLYYDPKTGTYFYYDHTSQAYQFHSQVPVSNSTKSTTDGAASANANSAEDHFKSKDADEDDGSIEYAEALMADMENAYKSKYGRTAEIPPSLRLMVTESGVETVKIGTLHLVTIDGGRVGRAQENLVQLEDETISRVHAEITYKSEEPNDHHYYIKDLGSALGTYINNTCISIPGEPSSDIEIGHGWELKFGTVKLKCHIHPGYLSCNDCEPGLVMANLPSQNKKYALGDIQKTRVKVVKAMKKKYALAYSSDIPALPKEYEDKARKRRKEKGSDNPYEKTEVASSTTEIKDSNKGFALLKKMGWSKGEALGKSQPGITVPIEATSKIGREGLGFSGGLPPPTSNQMKKKKILEVTRQRFNKR